MSCTFVLLPCASVVFTILVISCSSTITSPYPQSSVISEITFEWSTHKRRAPGSDNWPITWADDNHQYTAWGDGGGFGGTNSDGRVSLGVARIEGDRTSYAVFNVWGGKDPENAAMFGGKSYGILSVSGVLYMWVSPGSVEMNYTEARLYKSTDHGASWTAATWAFVKADGVIIPTFLQFGKDYQGARDNFVYIYASHFMAVGIQVLGEIALMRVPQTSIMDRSKYEFFAGLDGNGNPTWTSDIALRKPVFKDPNGVGPTSSASYNPGIDRYLLTTEHTESLKGNVGIFDAPEPWGPWTTVMYTNSFGFPTIEPTTFFWNVSNKWLNRDGRDFVLVFTGVGSNDSWNTVQGRFIVRPRVTGEER